jgi:ribosome maturation factor RimP
MASVLATCLYRSSAEGTGRPWQAAPERAANCSHRRGSSGRMRGPLRLARAAGAGGRCRLRPVRDAAGTSEEHTNGKPPAGLFVFGGPEGPFLFGEAPQAPGWGMAMTGTVRERLISLIEPLLGRLGYELVELEYSAGRAHAVLRLFIDREAGVTLDDCTQVSREVSAVLDVEDPIPSAYTLEVSSPGFDRVLRTQAHFGRFVGSRVFVELKEPRAGRRRYTGKLLTVDEGGIALEVDREQVTMAFEEIGKARLASSDEVRQT